VLILVGLVCGLLAVSLQFVPVARYSDDGTAAAFLIVLLALSSWFPAEVGSAPFGASLGAAAFGFFLFVPAAFAFDELGSLDAGSWLGLCTVLIPVGALVAAGPFGAAAPRLDLGVPVGLVGIVLLLVGIWLPIRSEGGTFWDGSSSGHALGLLMLLLAVVDAALLAAAVAGRGRVGELRIVVAAVTFGLLSFGVVVSAFEALGTLGSGSWLEACAGLLILLGAVRWSTGYEAVPVSASQSPR
jgi:hypothetical protein